VVFRPIDLYVITSTFFLRFLRFFENPKKRDFLRFFAVFHTFSRTMVKLTVIINSNKKPACHRKH